MSVDVSGKAARRSFASTRSNIASRRLRYVPAVPLYRPRCSICIRDIRIKEAGGFSWDGEDDERREVRGEAGDTGWRGGRSGVKLKSGRRVGVRESIYRCKTREDYDSEGFSRETDR